MKIEKMYWENNTLGSKVKRKGCLLKKQYRYTNYSDKDVLLVKSLKTCDVDVFSLTWSMGC